MKSISSRLSVLEDANKENEEICFVIFLVRQGHEAADLKHQQHDFRKYDPSLPEKLYYQVQSVAIFPEMSYEDFLQKKVKKPLEQGWLIALKGVPVNDYPINLQHWTKLPR